MADFDVSKFERVVLLMQKFQDVGLLDLAIEYSYSAKETYFYAPSSEVPEALKASLRELLDLLRIKVPEDEQRLKLTSRFGYHGPGELAMRTRSLLGTMLAVAQGFEPPEEHLKSGQVLKSADPYGFFGELKLRLIDIKHSRMPPGGAYVKVFYNGYWFYVDKDDMSSKRTLSLLSYLFSLQSTASDARHPIVTVGAGGS
jgi:hypothetical protein